MVDYFVKLPLFDTMSHVDTLLALAGSLFAAFLAYISYSLFFHPLAGLPGPLIARMGLGWMTIRALKHDMGWTLQEEHRKHGQIVRVARNMASMVDPSAITEMYRYGGKFEKTSFYTFFRAEKPSLMSTLGNHAHAELRRAESPAYTMTLLVELEEYVDSCLEDLVALFNRKIEASGKATIEMAETLQMLAMDVVGELAFGRSFGLCAAGEDTEGFFPMLESFVYSCALAGSQPWAGKALILFVMLRVGARGPQALGEKTTKAVQERLAKMKEGFDRNDMLSKLMKAKNPDGSQYSTRQIEVAATSILGAGSDTTAITMRALMRYIIGDKKIYDKVLSEIEEAIEEGNLNFPLTYAEGTKTSAPSVRQACLKETLRLHPAVPWTLPRVVPQGGAVLAGHFFPAGTEVAMSPFVVHRRPEAFGEDAAFFRPERWLEADAETKKVMERNLITFGSGSRVCIGKNISLMEITKVVPTLLHKYDFAFTPRSASSPHTKPGRRVDGVFDEKEPWHVASQWFATQSQFFMDVKAREA
ncbi:cytochrome P450 oxidoreductase [Leucosporidium creatinivorum]|uniref:Cytochrome P450 oxidoreductase n=1 Tax=Leucosporidium creatinivorum TaxID=106004 RepID=A0A1Y2D9S9_9BASI|nr:cytochrome P450 oxidoreductase [Leucosporidium creatinivorum]